MKYLTSFLMLLLLFACSADSDRSESAGTTGINGSITRFSIAGNSMYAIDVNYLRIYDISDINDPLLRQSVKVGYGLETISIYGDNIYIGAVDGVYIINITDPSNPVQLEKIEHHISCDPVVVQGDYAYSTQRANTVGCGNFRSSSVLAVYNVTDPAQASLTESINMVEPYGLSVQGDWLYVCDPGKGGIEIFDISDPAYPVSKQIFSMEEPRDIIARYPYMIITTKTRFEMYDYSDPLNLRFVSSLNLD